MKKMKVISCLLLSAIGGYTNAEPLSSASAILRVDVLPGTTITIPGYYTTGNETFHQGLLTSSVPAGLWIPERDAWQWHEVYYFGDGRVTTSSRTTF